MYHFKSEGGPNQFAPDWSADWRKLALFCASRCWAPYSNWRNGASAPVACAIGATLAAVTISGGALWRFYRRRPNGKNQTQKSASLWHWCQFPQNHFLTRRPLP
jgi:hypothetical protein